ncbi:hypothetical protein ACP70R_023469 [Stipagrostis hirtigluma subsp. patula]
MPSSTLLTAAVAAPRRRRRRRHGRPSESMTLHLSVFHALPLPSRDWAELPPELVSSIFHRLSPVHIMLAADKVCRSWRRAARYEPELWRRVDMRGRGHHELSYRNLVDLDKMAVDAVLRSRGQCEAFCAEGFAVDDDEFLRFLAGMVIATVREVRSLLLDRNDLTDRGLSAILDKCPHLEFLDIRNCRGIILNNTLRAKNARMNSKKLTTKILCSDPCSLNTLNPEALDIRHCRKIIMNSWWYKDIMNNGSGDRYSGTILRKRIRNYHRKNKMLMAELVKDKNYLEQGSGREDLRIIKNMERPEKQDYISMDQQEYGFGGYNNYKIFEPGCPISECSTCLMFEYFAKDCDGLDDDDDYADYYDPSYGLNNLDETDFHVLDSMIDKRLRRYLKME